MKEKYLFNPKGTLSVGKKILGWVFLFLSMSMIYGMWADFVPNGRMMDTGTNAAIISTIVLAVIYYIEVFLRPSPDWVISSSYKKLLIIVFIPLYFLFMFWLLFVHSIPALYTLFFGSIYEVDGVFIKVHTNSSRSCDYKIESAILENAFPDSICINERLYNQKSNEFRLVGKKSKFGEYYSDVYGKGR